MADIGDRYNQGKTWAEDQVRDARAEYGPPVTKLWHGFGLFVIAGGLVFIAGVLTGHLWLVAWQAVAAGAAAVGLLALVAPWLIGWKNPAVPSSASAGTASADVRLRGIESALARIETKLSAAPAAPPIMPGPGNTATGPGGGLP